MRWPPVHAAGGRERGAVIGAPEAGAGDADRGAGVRTDQREGTVGTGTGAHEGDGRAHAVQPAIPPTVPSVAYEVGLTVTLTDPDRWVTRRSGAAGRGDHARQGASVCPARGTRGGRAREDAFGSGRMCCDTVTMAAAPLGRLGVALVRDVGIDDDVIAVARDLQAIHVAGGLAVDERAVGLIAGLVSRTLEAGGAGQRAQRGVLVRAGQREREDLALGTAEMTSLALSIETLSADGIAYFTVPAGPTSRAASFDSGASDDRPASTTAAPSASRRNARRPEHSPPQAGWFAESWNRCGTSSGRRR